MADPANPAAPTPQDEKINALLDATAEEHHQADCRPAADSGNGSLDCPDPRVYVQTIETDQLETNGKAISVILDKGHAGGSRSPERCRRGRTRDACEVRGDHPPGQGKPLRR
ncbi:hypothetical protein [Loktanella sp. M215]|uniref:hypothetical protein n=1 Tax=Loktanella sp. M215 TaxID=2675431 RepID=UPI001F2D56AB|nr:hypothetical protein [Loktanella sp. M215]MCF7702453.1 hypothetical protein [Loktanella sp. M215]